MSDPAGGFRFHVQEPGAFLPRFLRRTSAPLRRYAMWAKILFFFNQSTALQGEGGGLSTVIGQDTSRATNTR